MHNKPAALHWLWDGERQSSIAWRVQVLRALREKEEAEGGAACA